MISFFRLGNTGKFPVGFYKGNQSFTGFTDHLQAVDGILPDRFGRMGCRIRFMYF